MTRKLTTEWVPYDPENLPDTEVLAIGYQNELIIGWLDDEGNCESDGELLSEVTYYIPVSIIRTQFKNSEP